MSKRTLSQARQNRRFIRTIAISVFAVALLFSGAGLAFFGYISSVFAATHLLPPAIVSLLSGFAPLISCLLLLGCIWYQFLRLLMIAEEILLAKIDHPEAQRRQWPLHLSPVWPENFLIKYLSLQKHSPPSLI